MFVGHFVLHQYVNITHEYETLKLNAFRQYLRLTIESMQLDVDVKYGMTYWRSIQYVPQSKRTFNVIHRLHLYSHEWALSCEIDSICQSFQSFFFSFIFRSWWLVTKSLTQVDKWWKYDCINYWRRRFEPLEKRHIFKPANSNEFQFTTCIDVFVRRYVLLFCDVCWSRCLFTFLFRFQVILFM